MSTIKSVKNLLKRLIRSDILTNKVVSIDVERNIYWDTDAKDTCYKVLFVTEDEDYDRFAEEIIEQSTFKQVYLFVRDNRVFFYDFSEVIRVKGDMWGFGDNTLGSCYNEYFLPDLYSDAKIFELVPMSAKKNERSKYLYDIYEDSIKSLINTAK